MTIVDDHEKAFQAGKTAARIMKRTTTARARTIRAALPVTTATQFDRHRNTVLVRTFWSSFVAEREISR